MWYNGSRIYVIHIIHYFFIITLRLCLILAPGICTTSSSSSSSSSSKVVTGDTGRSWVGVRCALCPGSFFSSSLDRSSTYSIADMECCQHSGWCRHTRRYNRGGYSLDTQSVEKLTYGWAKTMLVLEVIHYFSHFVRYCFPLPFRFPGALRGIVEERRCGQSCCSCARQSSFANLYCIAERANCLFSRQASRTRRSRSAASASQIRLTEGPISSTQRATARPPWCCCTVVLSGCHLNQDLSTVDTLPRNQH